MKHNFQCLVHTWLLINSNQVIHHPLKQPAVNTQKTNRGRQPNTSTTLSSFATLPAHNPIIQTSTQQGSNIGNCEALSDVQATFANPAYEFLDDAHKGSDYYNIEEPLTTPPPPNYNDLFQKLKKIHCEKHCYYLITYVKFFID